MRTGINSCTDITGFGLMGHLRGMARGSNVGAVIDASAVPVLPGVWDLLEKNVVPGGTFRNMNGVDDSVDWEEGISDQQRLLLCDAQTSGGLLISVTRGKVDQLISELETSGVETRALVGEITSENAGRIRVTA